MYSRWFFWIKRIARLFFNVRKSTKPYDFLPTPAIQYDTSTVVLYDKDRDTLIEQSLTLIQQSEKADYTLIKQSVLGQSLLSL